MINLSDHHKQEFEKRIKNISTKDEEKVRKSIQKQIEKLHSISESKSMIKMDDLLKDATLLYDILHSETYPISDSTRQWIVFGLGYLVSDFDLIPDSVPAIGYIDDALVLSWVVFMIKDVVARYESHLKAKELACLGGILNTLQLGDDKTEIIIIPGLLSDILDKDYHKNWLLQFKSISADYGNPTISFVDWDLTAFPNLVQTLKIVDHDLVLKPVYDSIMFGVEWEQLVFDFELLGKALAVNIQRIKNETPDKEIIVFAFDLGNYLVDSAIKELDKGAISKYHIFGGCKHVNKVEEETWNKVGKIYNYHSDKDNTLKFILENFEYNHKPLGLKSFDFSKSSIVKNINVVNIISNHHEYQSKLKEIVVNL